MLELLGGPPARQGLREGWVGGWMGGLEGFQGQFCETLVDSATDVTRTTGRHSVEVCSGVTCCRCWNQ